MKNKIRFCFISILILIGFLNSPLPLQAQDLKESFQAKIRTRSETWNHAFQSHDVKTFLSLFDSLAVMSSAGGRWVGPNEIRKLTQGLFNNRPDIRWVNEFKKAEIHEKWPIAYETGEWFEDWTEAGDKTKSEIRGKYWIMWRFQKGNWYILSAIFTPLSCKGSYCGK